MTDGAKETFTDDMRNAMMIIAGVRLGGGQMKMVHTGSFTTFIESKKSRGVWTPLKNPRRLMKTVVDKLVDQGYVDLVPDGADILIEQTEKRA